jgi:hypothetical protein
MNAHWSQGKGWLFGRRVLILVAVLSVLSFGARATTVTLSTSASTVVLGQPVTLTASVSPSTATGKITFYDGASLLGTRVLANGQAALATSLLGFGARSLRAYYGGDNSNGPASSPTLIETVHAAAGTGFTSLMNYALGTTVARLTYSIATGDLNGDGKTDLALTSLDGDGGTGAVSILLGNGDGTFQAPVNYYTHDTAIYVAVGDFNGDGKADLVVANTNGSVSVLIGNGDGTFQTPVDYAAGPDASVVVVGDFNGDGKADLAVSHGSGNNISVLLGNGDGTFQGAVSYLAGNAPYGIVVADVNGDGTPDLITANQSDSNVSVLLGNGNGTFKPPVNYPTGTFAYFVTTGDFNGDGNPDLATGNGESVSILLGNGDGTFRAPTTYPAIGGPFVAVADFNGDGKADLILPVSNGSIVVLPGNGDGSFQAGTYYPAGNSPRSVAVGDFNGDGRTDVAVADIANNSAEVLLATGGPRLNFLTQPVTGMVGVPLTPVLVQLLDATGNVNTTSSAPVTITALPDGVSVTVNAVNGLATFNNLILNVAGITNLEAGSAGSLPALSNSFIVTTMPTVAIDSPSSGSIITSGSTMVTGWALESAAGIGTAISVVQVLVDRVLVGTATYGLSRPDVCGLYPGRPGCPNVGYTFLLNTTSLTTGPHTLTVSAYDATSNVGSSSITIEVSQLMMNGTKVGVFRAGVGFLEDSNGNGIGPAPIDPGDRTVAFAPPGGVVGGDLPVVGDWTGDGHAKAGYYRPSTGTWWLDANNDGIFDAGDFTYQFGGIAGDLPVVGDWNAVAGVSAHKSCIGIFRGGGFWLLDLNCNGSYDGTTLDAFFPFGGIGGDVPVVGAWTGGTTQVGVVRKYAPGGIPQGNPFFWVLDAGTANAGSAPANHQPAPGSYAFGGLTGDVFVTGDWTNSGIWRGGVYRTGLWVLDSNGSHTPSLTFSYGGVSTDIPLPGKW